MHPNLSPSSSSPTSLFLIFKLSNESFTLIDAHSTFDPKLSWNKNANTQEKKERKEKKRKKKTRVTLRSPAPVAAVAALVRFCDEMDFTA